MANILTEDAIEQMALQTLQEQGYEIRNGADMERPYHEVILTDRLKAAIDTINPEIPAEVREEALRTISRIPFTNLLANNEAFHTLITEGIDVKGRAGEQVKTFKVWLIDFQHPENNDFTAVNQFTIIENHNNKRPDVIIFVNGLPLVVIEIKNATDEKADLKAAYNQLMTYKQAIPTLFNYNSFLIVTDGWFAKAGTITSDWSRFGGWKIPENPPEHIVAEPSEIYHSTLFPTPTANIEMDVVLSGMLNKKTIIDLIRYFIVFEKTKDKTVKKIAAYHQYYTLVRTRNAIALFFEIDDRSMPKIKPRTSSVKPVLRLNNNMNSKSSPFLMINSFGESSAFSSLELVWIFMMRRA